MNKQSILLAIVLCMLGTLCLGWGCAQLMMIVPQYSHFSDLAGLILGACLISMGYMVIVDQFTRPAFA